MNCKPGDLARVIDEPETRRCGTVDKIVKLTVIMGHTRSGQPAWGYEDPPILYRGEPVLGIADRLLRPISSPGDDARDETLAWKPVPLPEILPSLLPTKEEAT